MAAKSVLSTSLIVAIIGGLIAVVRDHHLQRFPIVFGVFKTPQNTTFTAADNFVAIPDTTYCEDLHYHATTKLLYAACEDNQQVRHSWFPPLQTFDDPTVASSLRGSLKVISPSTLDVRTLSLTGFNKPFVTHGIDVIDDPASPIGSAVYVFAVNHLPNDSHFKAGDVQSPKTRSVIEIFHHVVGSAEARHVRSVWHPLITTPNDVFALSPTSFFVTNDHHYRDGHMRFLEDLYGGAKWTNTIHVDFTVDAASTSDDSQGVTANVALDHMHNNNGLGHGKDADDIAVISATSGVLHIGKVLSAENGHKIAISESVEADSLIDNPSYFSDPSANSTFDGSGFVTCGIADALTIGNTKRDPNAKDHIMVWKISPAQDDHSSDASVSKNKWEKRLLFEDDGARLRSCSSAVLIAKDVPKNGQRRARLFATGFISRNMIAVDVDL